MLIVIISPDSMSSSNVEDEWQYFLDQHKPVIPVLLHPAKVHFQLSRIQYVDFSKQAYARALPQLHTVLRQSGLDIQPLPGSSAHLPAQESLPVRDDTVLVGGSGRRTGRVVLGVVIVIAAAALLFISTRNGGNVPIVAAEPTATAEASATSNPTTPAPTDTLTPTLTLTSTLTPTLTPTLSLTEIEGTVQGEMAAIPTQAAQTQAAVQTLTATAWTPTATFDARATAMARITETYEAEVITATEAFFGQQTQAALDLTATASLWTATPSLTPTPIGGSGQIAFSTRAGGNNDDIYLLDMITGDVTQLTNDPANDLYPAWSPDGKRIVFSSNRQGGNRDVYVMDADGGNLTRLTFNVDYEEDPAWSPDGRRIAFSSWIGDGKRDVFVMNADGTNVLQITTNAAEDRKPAWSPDGTHIAIFSDRKDAGYFQLYAVDATCTTPETCEASIQPINNAYGTFPAWSPDGKEIVYQSNVDLNFNLYVVNLDTGITRRLTEDRADDRRPAWSPDGMWVVFQSKRDGDYELYVVDISRGETRQLTTNTWDDNDPAWRPGS